MKNSKKIVLVVEDEKSLLNAAKLKLEKAGMEVWGASRVDEALKIIKNKKKVDVIWLDHYLLGDKNGLDFVVKVKGEAAWKKIPIFLISNTATTDKIDSYLRLGIHKYYTKSNLKLDDIVAEIKSLK